MKQTKMSGEMIAFVVFAGLTLINIKNCCSVKFTVIFLNENQILYIYSALAQVIGALLGLTIAGYSVMDAKIQSTGTEDDSITEYTENLRNNYFKTLMYIIGYSILDIALCLITLSIYNSRMKILLPCIMTETILLFLLIMFEVIWFALYLNPSAIKIQGSQEKRIIDSEYQRNTDYQDNDEIQDSFSSFVTKYNLLEHLVRQFACELIENLPLLPKLRFFEALDILRQHEIINLKAYSLINDLRRYRNALVHGLDSDKSVNPKIYNELKEIYDLLNDIHESYKNKGNLQEEDCAKKIENLYDYMNRHGIGALDKKMIEYLQNRSSASYADIANYMGFPRAYIISRLKLLQETGLIENQRIGKTNKWIVRNIE